MSADGDIAMMRRAITVAQANLGLTWPNPVVGCVLAKGGAVIAEAATGPGGRPHAEEQALAAAGEAARGAVAYVTLEPCGQRSNGTPSCGERLAASGVERVVIASANPEGLSAGRGLERLRAAGIPVEIGVLADEAAPLIAGFLHRLATGRPLVEISEGGEGFDAPFAPTLSESLSQALLRYGAEGYTRLWVTADSDLAEALAAMNFLGR